MMKKSIQNIILPLNATDSHNAVVGGGGHNSLLLSLKKHNYPLTKSIALPYPSLQGGGL